MVLLIGIEPMTNCLEGSCSIQLSYRSKLVGLVELEPTTHALKGHYSSIELQSRNFLILNKRPSHKQEKKHKRKD